MSLVRFFTFGGRTGIVRWLACLGLTLGIFWMGILALQQAEGAALVAVYAIFGMVTAKLATESVRRLHDCGQSGWLGLKVSLGIAGLLIFALLRSLGYGADAVTWGAFWLAVIVTAVLWLRPGIRAANAYDESPAGPITVLPSGGGTGLIIAIGFLAAGIGFGLAVLAWQAGMRHQRDVRMRNMAHQLTPDLPIDVGGLPAR